MDSKVEAIVTPSKVIDSFPSGAHKIISLKSSSLIMILITKIKKRNNLNKITFRLTTRLTNNQMWLPVTITVSLSPSKLLTIITTTVQLVVIVVHHQTIHNILKAQATKRSKVSKNL